MSTLHPSLFPETLLVDTKDGQAFTTSLKVAEHFHKAHRNVVRSIEKLLNDLPIDAFNVLNFERVTYKDRKGETRFTFNINRDAFVFLAMGFTGIQAMRWKLDFIHAFNVMEHALAAKTAKYAQALDMVRPNLRPVVEMTEQGLGRAAIAQPLGKSCNSVTYQRGQARRFGLLASKARTA